MRISADTLRGQNPLFLSVDVGAAGCLQPHASRPPPTNPYQNRGRNADDNANAMLRNLPSEIFKEDIGGGYPRAALVGENRTEGYFGRLFSTQQGPNLFLLDAWLASATYHSRVVITVTRVRVRVAHRRASLAFRFAVAQIHSSVSVAERKSRHLDLSFCQKVSLADLAQHVLAVFCSLSFLNSLDLFC